MLLSYVLIGLVSLLLLIIVWIVIGTLQSGISPMPSSNKAYQAMLNLVDQTEDTHLIDLGSGWGNVVIRLARRYPKRQVTGYELSFIPWLVSLLLKKALKLENLTLHRKNFLKEKWPEKATLICYLFPEVMAGVAKKLQQSDHSIQFVISNNFALPKHQPIQQQQINDFYKSPIYFYKLTK